MSNEYLLAELKRAYSDALVDPSYKRGFGFKEADIDTWSLHLDIPVEVLFTRIALMTAKGFHASELDYTFCDCMMNAVNAQVIWRLSQTKLADYPPHVFEVYQAFDAGEFRRSADPPEVIPAEKYTRPEIARIVAALDTTRAAED